MDDHKLHIACLSYAKAVCSYNDGGWCIPQNVPCFAFSLGCGFCTRFLNAVLPTNPVLQTAVQARMAEKTLPTLIQTNETKKSTQIDAFFESKPKIDAFLKIDANVQRQEYKMAS